MNETRVCLFRLADDRVGRGKEEKGRDAGREAVSNLLPFKTG